MPSASWGISSHTSQFSAKLPSPRSGVPISETTFTTDLKTGINVWASVSWPGSARLFRPVAWSWVDWQPPELTGPVNLEPRDPACSWTYGQSHTLDDRTIRPFRWNFRPGLTTQLHCRIWPILWSTSPTWVLITWRWVLQGHLRSFFDMRSLPGLLFCLVSPPPNETQLPLKKVKFCFWLLLWSMWFARPGERGKERIEKKKRHQYDVEKFKCNEKIDISNF